MFLETYLTYWKDGIGMCGPVALQQNRQSWQRLIICEEEEGSINIG